jgi:hypothetical protein
MLSGEEARGTDVVVSIVWTPMLPGDSASTAQAATALVTDARARHYFDPERRAGRAIASRLGGAGKIAWDIYLFFAPDAAWEDEPPLPLDWAHQLGDAAWVDPARCRRGEELVAALESMLHRYCPFLEKQEGGDL